MRRELQKKLEKIEKLKTSSALTFDEMLDLLTGKTPDQIERSRVQAKPPKDRDLHDDLIGVEYGYTITNQIQLEKKDDMKKRGLASPDFGDALALTFAYPVAPKGIETGPNEAAKARREYNPLYRNRKHR